jgi:hypothetical protein
MDHKPVPVTVENACASMCLKRQRECKISSSYSAGVYCCKALLCSQRVKEVQGQACTTCTPVPAFKKRPYKDSSVYSSFHLCKHVALVC